MKKSIFTLAFLLFVAVQIFAQTQQAINFQAIARDSNGDPIKNQSVPVEFIIRKNGINGTQEYTSNVNFYTTDDCGLFTARIGVQNAQQFAQINWADGTKFLDVKVNNVSIGNQQMVSVPYALYAEKTNLQAGTGISVSGNTISNSGDTNPNDDIKNGDSAGGGLSGTYPNPSIGANSVGSNQIINGSITSADLAPGIIPSPVETYIFDERYPHNTKPTTWSNTTDGTPLSNAFNTRKINTSIYSTPNASNVTLSPSTGQITFKPGVYLIQASAPAFIVARHKLFLRDVQNNSILLTGTDEFSNINTNGHSRSFITGVLVVTGADKIAKLDHYLSTADVNSGGVELGVNNSVSTPNINWNSISEIFTTILIQKIQ
jgi:hypothetical protein